MNINLFQQHYFDDNPERQKELDYCYEVNRQLKFDDGNFNYYLLSDRSTFNNIFELTKNFPNDINIHCNSDIYFEDESLRQLHNLFLNYKNKEKLVLALAPWDLDEKGNANLRLRSDSQDTWVFYGTISNLEFSDFYTGGLPGCENRMVAIFNRNGYIVKNPAHSIKTYHLHLSNVRHYNGSNRVHGEYAMVGITTIQDILNSQ